MKSELQEIVEGYRKDGLLLSDEEAEDIEKYCYRKMEVAKIGDKEGYLPLLFRDEIKNYFIGMAFNATTILREIEKEAERDVQCMQTIPVSSKVS